MRKLNMICLVFFVLFSMVSVSYSACEGDLNCGGDVDGSDLALFAADFGTTGCGNCDDVVARIEELEDKIAELEKLLKHFTRSGNNVYIEGANLHIRSGSGKTGGARNGLGNLIIGYNENGVSATRTGAHNLVIGTDHEYTSYAGLLAGRENTASGSYSCVLGYSNEVESAASYSTITGGYGNTVSNLWSSVSGGRDNTVSARYASISGGRYNSAIGQYSFIGGGGGDDYGYGNLAVGQYSAILGGLNNLVGDGDRAWDSNLERVVLTAGTDTTIGKHGTVSGGEINHVSGTQASVSGGYYNEASGEHASVSGGQRNEANGEHASVSGGFVNTASGRLASVSGGRYNEAIGDYASVSGGYDNEASGDYASVSGGGGNAASGEQASVSGGRSNDARGDNASVSGGRSRTAPDPNDWAAGSLFEEY
jgi:hypothetical protein